ncbi:DUF3829 domain-containing protein [Silvibacterium dinghuense]|uniref:DUF3829 domain-containing protein n=1 Tax=Silvibacterium dinghuense TaxID=1560006 RepID=A0A4Q1SC05_9BACT|nr:DUF3829 domain-containing protein [Silvibacterium dinghuense]RXS94547.1 DUF3829 domain-containing protein [Silvibacterium dinghuense]GGH15441.1 hypothetical protein GCM10011586_36520 [Silvibacterium dinghuense]
MQARHALNIAGAAVLLFGVSSIFNGCKSKPTVQQAVKTVLSSEDQNAMDKEQPIIECINQTFAHFEEMTPVYFQDMDQLKQSKTKDVAFFSFKIRPFEVSHQFEDSCIDGLNKSASMLPAIPQVDATAQDTANTLKQLQAPGDALEDYIRQKGWLADNFTKGKELDATLSPLLKRLWNDMQTLENAVHDQQTVLRKHELDAIEKEEGRNLHWHTMNSMLAARSLNDSVVTLTKAEKLDAQTMAAASKPLQDALDAARTYLATHPDEGKPDQRNMDPVWTTISSDLDRELGAARDAQTALPANGPLTDVDKKKARYPLQMVMYYYNQAVKSFNDAASMGVSR